MNKETRKIIEQAMVKLEEASILIGNAIEEQQTKLDNMPENLQGSERYSTMEDEIYELEDCQNEIDERYTALEMLL